MSYRVGIVGASPFALGSTERAPAPFQGEIVTTHAASLALVPRAEVVAVCRSRPEMPEELNTTWAKRWPNVSLYTDHREMLVKESLDLVAVVTPDDQHVEVTVDAAEAGVKGIFCEKPLATSLEEADRMIRACEDNRVFLTVDHTRRWNPLYHKVLDTVRSGAIGPLGAIVATLGGERAMLFRNGTHMIDSICFFADSEPVEVSARLEDGFQEWDRYMGDGGKDAAREPGATGLILFRNGVRALYCGTKGTFQTYELQLSGPRGQIRVNDESAELLTQDASTGNVVRGGLQPGRYQVQGLVAAYEELIGIVENGGTGVSSAREARKTLQIITGFLRSHQEDSRLVSLADER